MRSTRWVWPAAAALIVAVGAGLFVRLEGLKSHGPGPLSPVSSGQERGTLGPAKSGASAPETGIPQQTSANSAENAAPPGPGAQNSAGTVGQTGGSQRAALSGNPGQKPSAENGAGATPPEGIVPAAVGASETEKASPAGKAEAGPMQEEGMAEVNRAVAAGDVFFELGQYDRAVQTYQGPLKVDPNNKLLHSRIDRALKAKAAEQQFLGQ